MVNNGSSHSTNSNYPTFLLGERLTAEQLAFFEKNGFIHFKNFIPKEIVKQLLKLDGILVNKTRVLENKAQEGESP